MSRITLRIFWNSHLTELNENPIYASVKGYNPTFEISTHQTPSFQIGLDYHTNMPSRNMLTDQLETSSLLSY